MDKCLSAVGLLLFCAFSVFGQGFKQRGFIETRLTGYPQKAVNDRAQGVGEALFRYEAFLKPSATFQIDGSIDVRTDTHHEVHRNLAISWWDREERRPVASVRKLSVLYHSGGLSLEAGKQFIRWGKADILNPTDRFAPRDFLTVVDNDFLGITAARITYEKGTDTVEAIWSRRFTPSRVPLADQRWLVVRQNAPPPAPLRDAGTQYPGGPQAGLRWNHTGKVEFSTSYYEGFSHLPSFDAAFGFDRGFPVINVQRFYPSLRMVGADAAIPLTWFSVKGEAAYFTSKDRRADEYLQYVIQLERPSGEWTLIGGYAGEYVTEAGSQQGSFAPDRGFAKTFLGSARLTIDANRSLAFEASVRENLDGAWARTEYSQTFGQHWRATANVSVIRGKPSDFLGQYRLNSHATMLLRYSF